MSGVVLDKKDITGVVLAGGLARRMHEQDKGLIPLQGVPMIGYIINTLRAQVDHIFINVNRHQRQYERFGCPLIKDSYPNYCGPLAGIESAQNQACTSYVVIVPCDSPFIPHDLVERLAKKLMDCQADICTVDNGQGIQPIFSLIKVSLHAALASYLEQGGRKIIDWFRQHHLVYADFSDKPSMFDNINTPEDVESANQKIKMQTDVKEGNTNG